MPLRPPAAGIRPAVRAVAARSAREGVRSRAPRFSCDPTPRVESPPMDRDALERARGRIAEARKEGPSRADLEAALERAEAGLDALAQTAAELESVVPERLGAAVEEGMRAEVLPVARHIAEVRGLTGQMVRRIEALQAEVAAERRERLEDLAVLVELIGTGWRAVERRLDRAERILDRIERALEEQPGAALYRIDSRQAQ